VFTGKLDIKLERTTPNLLGSTVSIAITKENTILLNGEGLNDSIQARCEQILPQASSTAGEAQR
jgi:chaperonin GroEL